MNSLISVSQFVPDETDLSHLLSSLAADLVKLSTPALEAV